MDGVDIVIKIDEEVLKLEKFKEGEFFLGVSFLFKKIKSIKKKLEGEFNKNIEKESDLFVMEKFMEMF